MRSTTLEPSTLSGVPGGTDVDFSEASVKVIWTAGGESGTILQESRTD